MEVVKWGEGEGVEKRRIERRRGRSKEGGEEEEEKVMEG